MPITRGRNGRNPWIQVHEIEAAAAQLLKQVQSGEILPTDARAAFKTSVWLLKDSHTHVFRKELEEGPELLRLVTAFRDQRFAAPTREARRSRIEMVEKLEQFSAQISSVSIIGILSELTRRGEELTDIISRQGNAFGRRAGAEVLDYLANIVENPRLPIKPANVFSIHGRLEIINYAEKVVMPELRIVMQGDNAVRNSVTATMEDTVGKFRVLSAALRTQGDTPRGS